MYVTDTPFTIRFNIKPDIYIPPPNNPGETMDVVSYNYITDNSRYDEGGLTLYTQVTQELPTATRWGHWQGTNEAGYKKPGLIRLQLVRTETEKSDMCVSTFRAYHVIATAIVNIVQKEDFFEMTTEYHNPYT